MSPQAGPPVAGERLPKPPARDAANEYRRLVATLAAKARWLGSRDPESAAQETLTRSLENPASQARSNTTSARIRRTVCTIPSGRSTISWPGCMPCSATLFARNAVVRVSSARCRSAKAIWTQPIPATGPLEAMIEQELRAIIVNCFPKLDREQRQVLTMRVNGLKYGEIASRLGVNENTVATWVSRGIRELGRSVRKRMRVR